MKSIVPSFGISKISADASDVGNPQLAATVFALDIPLLKENPYSVIGGDGIQGRSRVTWHFSRSMVNGRTAHKVASQWHDSAWIDTNESDPVSVCRRSFNAWMFLKESIRTRDHISEYFGSGVKITNTRKSAVMMALGHPLKGWKLGGSVITFCFDEAAASDAALFDSNIYETLPTNAISYAKGAILGHELMCDLVHDIQYARVEHRGKAAIIGKDITADKLRSLEKILYRK